MTVTQTRPDSDSDHRQTHTITHAYNTIDRGGRKCRNRGGKCRNRGGFDIYRVLPPPFQRIDSLLTLPLSLQSTAQAFLVLMDAFSVLVHAV
jgi:hypothetical protein